MTVGIIILACGIHTALMGYGVLPRKVKDPERIEQWRKKFGRTMRMGGLGLCVYGILQIARHWM